RGDFGWPDPGEKRIVAPMMGCFHHRSYPAPWNRAVVVALLVARQQKEDGQDQKDDHAPAGIAHIVTTLNAGDKHECVNWIAHTRRDEIAGTLGSLLQKQTCAGEDAEANDPAKEHGTNADASTWEKHVRLRNRCRRGCFGWVGWSFVHGMCGATTTIQAHR